MGVITEFLGLGFKAIVVAVSARVLDQSFVGRNLDASFIADLPYDVDPCGENGEFHTFVYDGPIFSHPLLFRLGETPYKTYPIPQNNDDCFSENTKLVEWDNGFWFCDLLLQKTI